MSLYDRLYKTATKLIKKYGTVNTFNRVQAGAYDPLCGKPRLNNDTTYSASIVKSMDMVQTQPNHDLVSKADLTVIATASSFEKNDTVLIDGVKYSIIDYEPIYPGDKVLAVWLFLRR